MDIKDFILIGGGLLIAMVVGHGFWIAYRARREPLRLDIVPDLIPGHQDEMERLRGELPNGGARVVNKRKVSPEQESFDLEVPPVLMEPADPLLPEVESPATRGSGRRPFESAESISLRHAPARRSAPVARVAEVSLDDRDATPSADQASGPREEIQLEIQADAPTGKTAEPIVSEPVSSRAQRGSLRQRVAQEVRSRDTRRREESSRQQSTRSSAGEDDSGTERVRVEELLVINVLARKGEHFDGEGIVETLRKQGLRYGDMNIFHRVDPATKAKMYSVANIVEPGTFDMSDLQSMHSPGMSFFLQLPGPEEPMVAFADMLEAARNVAVDLGGEMRDEQLSKLTGQTAEHMRQRIADFTRRRLSKRA